MSFKLSPQQRQAALCLSNPSERVRPSKIGNKPIASSVKPLPFIENILSQNRGAFVSDMGHAQQEVGGFLADHLKELKAAGVDMLAMEAFETKHQKLLDQYAKASPSQLKSIEKQLRETALGEWAKNQGSHSVDVFMKLVEKARLEKINIVAIDKLSHTQMHTSGKQDPNTLFDPVLFSESKRRNKDWSQTVQSAVENQQPKKFIVYGGDGHTDLSQEQGYQPIQDLLNVPAIKLSTTQGNLAVNQVLGNRVQKYRLPTYELVPEECPTPPSAK